jgi:hypothetical protein
MREVVLMKRRSIEFTDEIVSAEASVRLGFVVAAILGLAMSLLLVCWF